MWRPRPVPARPSVLMKRYLALLARVREPEEILALTFTRKAAGELRTRIQNELNKREEPSETETISPHESELRELALAAVRRHVDKGISLLERLQVNTFHGFCAQLLRLAPQAAGTAAGFWPAGRTGKQAPAKRGRGTHAPATGGAAGPRPRPPGPGAPAGAAEQQLAPSGWRTPGTCCPGGIFWGISLPWPGRAGTRPRMKASCGII